MTISAKLLPGSYQALAELRSTSVGHGDTYPISDNKPAAGRSKNKRTEMAVRNF